MRLGKREAFIDAVPRGTEMRQRLERWIAETNDHGRNPESAKMYDSDMAVYLGSAGKKGRNEQLEKNIALMKQWAAEGK